MIDAWLANHWWVVAIVAATLAWAEVRRA